VVRQDILSGNNWTQAR